MSYITIPSKFNKVKESILSKSFGHSLSKKEKEFIEWVFESISQSKFDMFFKVDIKSIIDWLIYHEAIEKLYFCKNYSIDQTIRKQIGRYLENHEKDWYGIHHVKVKSQEGDDFLIFFECMAEDPGMEFNFIGVFKTKEECFTYLNGKLYFSEEIHDYSLNDSKISIIMELCANTIINNFNDL